MKCQWMWLGVCLQLSCSAALPPLEPKRSHAGEPAVEECNKGNAAACWTAGMKLGLFAFKGRAPSTERARAYLYPRRSHRDALRKSDRPAALIMLLRGCELGHGESCWAAAMAVWVHRAELGIDSKEDADEVAAPLVERGCGLFSRSACVVWRGFAKETTAVDETICRLGGAPGTRCQQVGEPLPLDAWHPPGEISPYERNEQQKLVLREKERKREEARARAEEARRNYKPVSPITPEELMSKSWRLVIGETPEPAKDDTKVLDFWWDGTITGGGEYLTHWRVVSRGSKLKLGTRKKLGGRGVNARWMYEITKRLESADGLTRLQGPHSKKYNFYLIEVPYTPIEAKELSARVAAPRSSKAETRRLAKQLRAAAPQELAAGRWGTAGHYIARASALDCGEYPSELATKLSALQKAVPRIAVRGTTDGYTAENAGEATAVVKLQAPRVGNLEVQIVAHKGDGYRKETRSYSVCGVGSQCFADWEKAVYAQRHAVDHMEVNQQRTSGGNATSSGLARYGETADLSGKTDSDWVRGKGVGSYTSSGYTSSELQQAKQGLTDLLANDPRKNPEVRTLTWTERYDVQLQTQIWTGEFIRSGTYREPGRPALKTEQREPFSFRFEAVVADPANRVKGRSDHKTKSQIVQFALNDRLASKGRKQSAQRTVIELRRLAEQRRQEVEIAGEKHNWPEDQARLEAQFRASLIVTNPQTKACDTTLGPSQWL